MKTAYLDCSSGISGDMFLGALISLGAKTSQIQIELDTLKIEGLKITSKDVIRAGIKAKKANIKFEGSSKPRRFNDINKIISKSTLHSEVKSRALRVFARLFHAEAKVHGKPFDIVHLHELGAEDAIADITGTLCALRMLGIEKVVSSRINLGGGHAKSSHGTFPAPAPATLELLRGAEVYSSGAQYELTTPTGAALVAELAESFGPIPSMHLDAQGAGAGTLDIAGTPNVLRIVVGHAVSRHADTSDNEIIVLETNIDDMEPRLYPNIIEGLMQLGALDAYHTPIVMKKGRHASKLTALCGKEGFKAICNYIFRETPTIGIRHCTMLRTVLRREILSVETPWGSVRVKKAYMPGGKFKLMPEYDDCAEIAKIHGIPIRDVLQTAIASSVDK